MNLLICTGSDSSYNSLRPEHEIYISMAKQGHNITIITHRESEYYDRFKEHGIDVIDQPIVKKLSLTSIRLIRRLIKLKSIDIVFATNSKTIPNSALACIGLPVKLIAYRGTASGLYWHDPGNYLGMYNPRIDGIICVSKYVYDFVKSRALLKNKKIVSIYKGHDLSWYDKQAADLAEFGITAENFTAICVINSRPHKGLDVMLKAANRLSDIQNFHLLIVGKGTENEPYKSLLENNSMINRIHIAGYRNDAPELIAASDILIQPSIGGEGLPRVILESLAYGTPVIASSIEGSMEIIDEGVNGLIVKTKDDRELADAIRKLYNSPELLSTLKSNSKKTLESKMSHRVTVEKFTEYFQSLLQ